MDIQPKRLKGYDILANGVYARDATELETGPSILPDSMEQIVLLGKFTYPSFQQVFDNLARIANEIVKKVPLESIVNYGDIGNDFMQFYLRHEVESLPFELGAGLLNSDDFARTFVHEYYTKPELGEEETPHCMTIKAGYIPKDNIPQYTDGTEEIDMMWFHRALGNLTKYSGPGINVGQKWHASLYLGDCKLPDMDIITEYLLKGGDSRMIRLRHTYFPVPEEVSIIVNAVHNNYQTAGQINGLSDISELALQEVTYITLIDLLKGISKDSVMSAVRTAIGEEFSRHLSGLLPVQVVVDSGRDDGQTRH